MKLPCLLALLSALLTGCGAVPVAPAQAADAPVSVPASPTATQAKAAGFDLSALPIATFTHDDLKAAADYATGNGYPARAAVYMAIDQQLMACEKAISAAAPKLPAPGAVGFFTAFEVAAEAVGTGTPAAVRLNCSAVQFPRGLVLK